MFGSELRNIVDNFDIVCSLFKNFIILMGGITPGSLIFSSILRCQAFGRRCRLYIGFNSSYPVSHEFVNPFHVQVHARNLCVN